ncbi:pentatricopeptide repeat-containing protein At4g16835, mitochondrial [Eucalyptus grandis]|uniref:pentatricopeptide repeat-containing protein At4g16835, mitochondrial n=1 Tax=Eucalyptus grandis TaxID=71139 RepID=UPI00192EA54E|nr:pentatricopeptide repeat-containing protein At4g16835, mitochondrial [Eucalyptus grandis]
MFFSDIVPTIDHYVSLIARCVAEKHLKLGMTVHKAFDDLDTMNSYSWNTIISAYARIGDFKKALVLFDEMPQRALVSYNSLISGLSRHGFYVESLSVFMHMQKEYDCLFMDEFTFVGVVGACARLGAFKFLRQVMPEKDIVSWTSMDVAYTQAQNLDDACFVQNGHGDEALDLFLQMHEEGIQPSPHTFVSDLCACADQALGERGKQIHGYIARTCFNKALENIFIWNALIDIYCKCGDMRSAAILFLRMLKRDIVSWNSMITGFAQNGLGHESLVFLKTMLEMNVRPNLISFLGALSACSHTGLDVEALQIFNAMEKDYSLQPRFDHYTILVDLLGRKNRLEEAMELIESVSNKSKHVGMWGALLGACKVHGNLVIARKAVDALLNLELQNAARYVMLSSINAKLTDGMIPAE